ncbi:MAG TPA: DUF134 domain-containing protein [Bacillota bacterium]
MGGIILPRCKKERCCRHLDNEVIYKPAGVPCPELHEVRLELDEFEALRLCDLDGLDQEAAGARMGISRGTVQRLLASGRRKLIGAIVDQAALRIADPRVHTECE